MKMIDEIICGDCLEVIKEIPDNSIDAVVTDPPYGLGFMGKEWDTFEKEKELQEFTFKWASECFRVLKSGGHLLSFGGTRTYHRLASAIEDSGFEIRDMIEWVYGSGLPKSLNISKQIDKQAGAERKPILDENGNQVWTSLKQRKKSIFDGGKDRPATYPATYPATPFGIQWEGWGTALKPAHEPICMARKPISEKTVAENVLKWRTGGININGCRIGTEEVSAHHAPKGTFAGGELNRGSDKNYYINIGRFPANLVHDGSEEVLRLFPEQESGERKSSYHIGDENGYMKNHGIYGKYKAKSFEDVPKSKGSAARFFETCEFTDEDFIFYCPKASRQERDFGLENLPDSIGGGMKGTKDKSLKTGAGNERNNLMKNNHPTVKPIKLMRYLIRLVTPPNGVVLDPFMGSGTTIIACLLEGFHYLGIEKEEEYFKIAQERIEEWEKRFL